MKRKRSNKLSATGTAGGARAKAGKEQKLATPQPPPGQAVKKGFFDLPRELRDMIFDLVWTDTSSIRQHHAGNVYTVTYGVKSNIVTASSNCDGESAAWLLANKQMLQEGLEQLSQKIIWHFRPSIRRSQWKIRNSRLLTPYKARGYQLQFGSDEQGLWMNFHKIGYILTDGQFTDTRIPQMIDFTKRTSIVTTLHVDIRRDHLDATLIDHVLEHEQVDFHLWQLEQLSVCTRLRKFSVTLHDDYGNPSNRWMMSLADYKFDPEERFLESLRKELSRIGRILVGDGKETVMSFDTYFAQYQKLEDGGTARWEYMIEK